MFFHVLSHFSIYNIQSFHDISRSEISPLPSTPQTSLLRAAARRLRKDPGQLPAFTAESKHVDGVDFDYRRSEKKTTAKKKTITCELM